MVRPERLAQTFTTLAAIGSESRRERRLAAVIERMLRELGAEVAFDDAGSRIGGDCGNLIARLAGTVEAPPLLLNAHMDTVGPGEGVQVRFAEGVFTSDGTTILGADDKSALAVILEALSVLRETGAPHGPLEIVFTVAEETGLAGAKALDFGRLQAAYGYALDGSDTEGIIVRAPAADRFEIRVHGRDAHAGAHPERGINAIHLAAKALAGLEIGRIDRETTCNIGSIAGGTATNIVPARVTLRGEARSHDEEKLDRLTASILAAFEAAAAAHREAGSADGLPRVESEVTRSYRPTRVPEGHPLVLLARRAAEALGRPMKTKTSGGGSDANIFFAHGIPLGVLGTGMRDIHTLREHVRLEDMVRATQLLVEIVRLHPAGHRPA